MVQGVIRVSLEAWKIKDEPFDYVTIQSRYGRMKESKRCLKLVEEFMQDLNLKLNAISRRGKDAVEIWTNIVDDDAKMVFCFITDNEDMGLKTFRKMFDERCLPILSNVEVGSRTVSFEGDGNIYYDNAKITYR